MKKNAKKRGSAGSKLNSRGVPNRPLRTTVGGVQLAVAHDEHTVPVILITSLLAGKRQICAHCMLSRGLFKG